MLPPIGIHVHLPSIFVSVHVYTYIILVCTYSIYTYIFTVHMYTSVGCTYNSVFTVSICVYIIFYGWPKIIVMCLQVGKLFTSFCLFVCLCDVFMLIVMIQNFGIEPEEDSEDKIDEDVEAEGLCALVIIPEGVCCMTLCKGSILIVQYIEYCTCYKRCIYIIYVPVILPHIVILRTYCTYCTCVFMYGTYISYSYVCTVRFKMKLDGNVLYLFSVNR